MWETFLDNVYNRVERRTGWVILILGSLIPALIGIYAFIVQPWTSTLQKILIAAPTIGLSILFISVLRQRLYVAKTDRYSRDVKR